jgi:hypothetical protein
MVRYFQIAARKVELAWLRYKQRAMKRKIDALRSERLEALTGQIGLMTITWAKLEMILDITIAMVHAHGGSTEIQPDLPASLKSKLAYFRKVPRKISALAHTDGEVQDFIDSIQSIKDIRHDSAHGLIEILDEGFDVQITRFSYAGASLARNSRVVGQKELSEAAKTILDLCQRSAPLAASFANALGESELEDAFRDLAIKASLSVELSNDPRAVINQRSW